MSLPSKCYICDRKLEMEYEVDEGMCHKCQSYLHETDEDDWDCPPDLVEVFEDGEVKRY